MVLRDGVMVTQRSLKASILVRIQVPQQSFAKATELHAQCIIRIYC